MPANPSAETFVDFRSDPPQEGGRMNFQSAIRLARTLAVRGTLAVLACRGDLVEVAE